MDAFDLFRRLGAGARFDLKKFGKDAERFKVVKSKKSEWTDSCSSVPDFFSADSSSVTAVRSGDEHDSDSELETEGSPLAGKRKRGTEESGKNQTPGIGDSETPESDGILWTSSLDKKAKGPSGKSQNPSWKRLKHLHQEKVVNGIRHKHKIYTHGSDLPDPVTSFEQLQEEYKIHPRIIHNIKEAGFQGPTPIQMQAIPVMLHSREVLACAPTGSGKTVAFCLPILCHLKQPMNKGFRALVLSPTRELASQTHRELVKLSDGVGFRVHMIHKGAEAAKKFGPKSSKKYDILVTTPNRLVYLLKQDPPGIDLSNVEWLVVDESDKLFEEGKSGFREQLAAVFMACSSHLVKRAMFSATFAPDVEQWCKLNLDNLVSISIGQRNSAVETVEQQLLFVGTENGKLVAMRDLVKKGFLPPVLVFVQSIQRAKELFHELVYEGINVEVIHAERTQQQRDNVVTSFRAGKIWVLICTALLARGIDFKGVNLVINYDFPTSSVEYIHRIGRTGRAGHRGKAITLFTEEDKPLLRSIANVIKQAGCPVPDYMIGFKKLHSKQKTRLMKRPPRRETIRTTPLYLMKGKGKGNTKRKAKRRNNKEEKAENAPSAPAETAGS
ncbi:putative ATP-dependent RNA helicase DDX52 [Acipenser oxyrinchus oxyrinchus]|uniref:Probable ATP-dependent RNA helicase DDX52 n=1 Tax=Acipenser oxyrinchus oxyrinchus TaxID=40147 RepID=A0AAD8FVK9_ACIOX|nr:putative ATP-dependent RNA helicase DDX52 [Acipenser oxyrinchus oxyrinchus]